MGIGAPAVKIAGQVDGLSVRGPDGEIVALLSQIGFGMSAKLLKDFIVSPGPEQVAVQFRDEARFPGCG